MLDATLDFWKIVANYPLSVHDYSFHYADQVLSGLSDQRLRTLNYIARIFYW